MNNIIEKIENLSTDMPNIYNLSLSDISVDDFMLNHISYYFKTVFDLIYTVDDLVQQIFTCGEVNYDYSNLSDDIYGIIIYNMFINRLNFEHHISDKHIYHNNITNYTHSINLTDKVFHVSFDYNRNNIPADRLTGDTTRNADFNIKNMFESPNVPILLIDTYTLMRLQPGIRNNLIGNYRANSMLFDKIFNRLNNELPKNIFEMISFNRCENSIRFVCDINLYDNNNYLNYLS